MQDIKMRDKERFKLQKQPIIIKWKLKIHANNKEKKIHSPYKTNKNNHFHTHKQITHTQ